MAVADSTRKHGEYNLKNDNNNDNDTDKDTFNKLKIDNEILEHLQHFMYNQFIPDMYNYYNYIKTNMDKVLIDNCCWYDKQREGDYLDYCIKWNNLSTMDCIVLYSSLTYRKFKYQYQ